MSNMSYCRFENTYGDLMDCFNALRDNDIQSEGERKKAKRMLEEICEFVLDQNLIEWEINECAIDEWMHEIKRANEDEDDEV